MEQTLTDAEVRVLGALIEKEVTTPDYYPLTLNALTAACNQSSNRSPITKFDEETVIKALEGLREKKLLHMVDRSDSRVTRYRHVLYEALDLGRPAIAVMCVLMLRGPQTVGEIRTEEQPALRLFESRGSGNNFDSLITGNVPFVVRLPRQVGQKEVRYAHLLSGEVRLTEMEPEPELDRIGKLEKEIEDLKIQFEQFKKQFE